MSQKVKVEHSVSSVFYGVYFAVLVLLIATALASLIFGHKSLRDIGSPCRDHGGVQQYIPTTFSPLNFEKATVVCKDGKVGRV